jgi:O-antigen/teichoic acid export membrane protein
LASVVSKRFVTVLTGNAFATGAGFLVSILVARSMTVADYGVFGTFNVIIGMLPMLLDFGLSTAIVKHLAVHPEDEATVLASSSLFKLCCGLALTAPLLFFAPALSGALFSGPVDSSLLNYIWLGALFLQIAFVFQSVAQTEAKLNKYTSFNLIQAAARLILVLLVVNSEFFTLKNLVIAISASCLFPFFWGLILYLPKLRLSIDWRLLARLFSFAKWVGISSVLAVLLMRVDLFMLNRFSSREEVGYYYAAFQLAFVFPIVTMSLTNSLLPKVSSLVGRNEQLEFVNKVVRLIPWVVALWLVLTISADTFIPLLFSVRYLHAVAPFKPLLAVFMLGMIVTPLGLLAYPLNRPQLHVKLYAIQIAINLAVDYLLIPRHGALGAALGTAAAKLFGAFFVVYWIWRYVYAASDDTAPELP